MRTLKDFFRGVQIGIVIAMAILLLEYIWSNTDRIEINRDHPYR
jgi:hypothetical protein